MKELGSVGFVLVAGGLGERLGYEGAKVSLLFAGLNLFGLDFYGPY
jgi:UDP-N-acetylglucosamine pyrophosphorylase